MTGVIKTEHFLNIYNTLTTISLKNIWKKLKQHMKMYFTLNTGKLQDHRFAILLPQIFFFVTERLNELPETGPTRLFFYLQNTLNLKLCPSPKKGREVGVGYCRLFKEMRFSDANWTWVLNSSQLKSTLPNALVSRPNSRFWKITELPGWVSDNFTVNSQILMRINHFTVCFLKGTNLKTDLNDQAPVLSMWLSYM